MTTRRAQTSAESREAILAAAAELFGAKGYRQTTFVDIAERSGVSRGSIPWHFGSKEGLLLAVLEHSMGQFLVGLDDDSELPAGLGIDHVTQALGALFARPTSRLFGTLLVEALEPDSPIRDRYVAIQDNLRRQCARWLERFAPRAGVPVEALAAAVIGAAIGIHLQWVVAPDRVDVGQSLAGLRALLAGVLPAEG